MEILRWCNQPSMALINHIEEDDFTQEWKRALGHYFKLIRTYNPMQATYKEHISILESMAHLNEEWTQSIQDSIALFEKHHQQMLQECSSVIVDLIYSTLRLKLKLPIKTDHATQEEELKLQEEYKTKIRQLETKSYKRIADILHHNRLDKEIFDLGFEEIDLFSKESASIFGLSKKELLITTTSSGALTGAGVDLLFAGHTGFLGAAIGGIVGGIGGYFGFEELFKTEILGKKLGEKYLQIGPMQNRNFPYILLGRSLFYTKKLLNYSHAKRDTLTIDKTEENRLNILSDKERQQLEKYHKLMRSKKELDAAKLHEYEQLILKKLTNDQ